MSYRTGITVLLVTVLMAGPVMAQQAARLFVVNKQSDTMSIVDPSTLDVGSTVEVGSQPHEMAITPSGAKAYVSNVGDNNVSVIDLGSGKETKKITSPDFSFPHGIAFTPDARIAILTSERTQKIFVIDATTDEIIRAVDTDQGGTHMVVIDGTGRWAYFTNRDSNSVSVMDLADYSLVATIPAGDGAEGIALSPDGTQLWTGDRRGDTVTVIDTQARRVIRRLEGGQAPIRAGFSPDGAQVYVPNSLSSDVWVFDAQTLELVGTVDVGASPGGVTFSPDGARAYVACGRPGEVHVIDTETLTVVAKIPVGAGPDGITFQ